MSKSGRRAQLDRDHLIQMATAQDFYAAVPAFLYLKDVAFETKRILESKADCQKCYHEWNAFRGIVDAMFLKLKELKATNSPVLAEIKDWLSTRKGFRVESCVLYYRRSRTQGAIAKFEF